MALANHCPYLSELCVHFQVASLSTPPAIARMMSNVVPTDVRRDCALTDLEAGAIHVSEESVLVVALTLVRIFPHLVFIDSIIGNWRKVMAAIYLSRQIVDYSGEEHPSLHLEVPSVTPPQKLPSGVIINRETDCDGGDPGDVSPLARQKLYFLGCLTRTPCYDGIS